MTLTRADHGRIVETPVGSVLTIRLPESPGTGYRWTVETALGLDPIDDRFESVGGIGVSGTRELQFRAARVGLFDLRLKYWREWEGDRSVDQRFAVKIRVR
jgi:inhibitor of cysteine peptidase